MMNNARKLRIDADRLQRRIDMLASMTVPGRPWERTAFSGVHHDARAYLAEEMRKIGLETSIDAAGNLIGRDAGSHDGLAPIALGPHSDTVPEGGRYDGVAGVLAALEIAQALHEAGHRLRHPLEVIDFLGEEPNKYGLSCVGSRGMAGCLTEEMLEYGAADGSTLAEGIAQMGGEPGKLAVPLRKPGDTAAFLELHIEQGRILESADEDIGIVTGIVGIARLDVAVSGLADHAGTTPMNIRKDALAGASRMICDFERRARGQSGCSLVATVGKLDVSPNATNAVPGQVSFTLEARSDDDAALQEYMAWAQERISRVCSARNLRSKTRPIGQSSTARMAEGVQSAILDAAASEGYKSRFMPSGAGHDAAYMARIAPTGMAFVPCLEGRSHCPEEHATRDQVAKGAQTLLTALLDLDRSLN